MRVLLIYIFLLVIISSCHNKIETGKTLKKKDLDFIHSLGLLQEGESISKFYSEYKNSVAGNFYTNRRMAKYWIDERDKSKNEISFAYYPEIISIDTVYYAGATYCPFMRVTKADSSVFKVCVDGTKEEIKGFFEEALDLWRKGK